MNAQTPFDLDDYACAHGLYADEHCPMCAGIAPVDDRYSPRRRFAIIAGLVVGLWGLFWLTLSWLERVL